MAYNAKTIGSATRELLTAYRRGTPIEPLSRDGRKDLNEAYEIQAAQVDSWVADGASIRGYKIGLTSVVMQRLLGVSEPDYGHIIDSMVYHESDVIKADCFLQPRIEPELAFVLRSELQGPGLGVGDVATAIDTVTPAFEIIDSRIADWRITLYDTIADNASSAAIVLGGSCVPLDRVDLRVGGCNVWRNGELVATGASGAVLGNPLLAIRWLANKLGEHGVVLKPGHILLAGSCTSAVPIRPGDTATAAFAGLGSVSVRYQGVATT